MSAARMRNRMRARYPAARARIRWLDQAGRGGARSCAATRSVGRRDRRDDRPRAASALDSVLARRARLPQAAGTACARQSALAVVATPLQVAGREGSFLSRCCPPVSVVQKVASVASMAPGRSSGSARRRGRAIDIFRIASNPTIPPIFVSGHCVIAHVHSSGGKRAHRLCHAPNTDDSPRIQLVMQP